jgi:hypothetical protein
MHARNNKYTKYFGGKHHRKKLIGRLISRISRRVFSTLGNPYSSALPSLPPK